MTTVENELAAAKSACKWYIGHIERQDVELNELRLELANATAMVREAVTLIEELLPGIGVTTVNVGKLNDWLLRSREYTK